MCTFFGWPRRKCIKKKKKEKDFIGVDSGWESMPITALVITVCYAAVQTTGRTSYSLVQQMFHPRFCIKNEGIY